MQYECAIMEVHTKLHVLNNEFSHLHQRNPIETIKTRIKTPTSILEKLNRRNLPHCENTGKRPDGYRRNPGHMPISG